MKVDDIKRVLILGSGTMGQQIGLQCALYGYDVVLYDINKEMLEKAMLVVKKIAEELVSSKQITQEKADSAVSRIEITTNPEEAAKNIDLINESVPEDPVLKGEVFEMFNKLCPEHTIFTTNTSLLRPSLFADATGRPEKFLALHFHDIRMTNVVDIMPHPKTSKEAIELVQAFAESIGQLPIMLMKETSGYVFNAMISTLFRSAQTLAVKGITSIQDIDRAWMAITHMDVGPFGLMDRIGIETVWKITQYWATTKNDSQGFKNAEFLKQYIDKGMLGVKTGKGFYEYPKPLYEDPDFLKVKKLG